VLAERPGGTGVEVEMPAFLVRRDREAAHHRRRHLRRKVVRDRHREPPTLGSAAEIVGVRVAAALPADARAHVRKDAREPPARVIELDVRIDGHHLDELRSWQAPPEKDTRSACRHAEDLT